MSGQEPEQRRRRGNRGGQGGKCVDEQRGSLRVGHLKFSGTPEAAAQFAAHAGLFTGPPGGSCNDHSSHISSSEEDGALLAFPDMFKELLAAVPHITKQQLPPALKTDIRALVRARERVGHIVPTGKCNRVLGQVEDFIRSAPQSTPCGGAAEAQSDLQGRDMLAVVAERLGAIESAVAGLPAQLEHLLRTS